MERWLGWLSILSCLGLTECNLTALTLGLAPSDRDASMPPCVGDDCNCGDFIHQALAQQVLKGYWGDPYNLDSDNNGRACERLSAKAPEIDPPAPLSRNPHLALGNPSNASSANPNNYLIERPQYALAYSRDRNLAHWVSWRLDASWLGSAERQDDFRQDGTLPSGFYQVTPTDFRGSGYDRGHLAPSGDRTANARDNSATFLMTNIIPQAPDNNRGLWRELEEHTRDLVYQLDQDIYVMAGSYGVLGTLKDGSITVPSRLWKVIVVLDPPGIGSSSLSPQSQVIAVDIPNRNDLKDDWRAYQTSIDRIEIATGLDLLSQVPDKVEAALEAQNLRSDQQL